MRNSNRTSIIILIFILMFQFISGSEIHEAVKTGDLRHVKEILNKNPILVSAYDERKNTPLHIAARSENTVILNFLIGKNSDLNASNNSGYTPLHYAAYYNHVENVKLLLQKGAQTDPRSLEDETPLHMTAYSGGINSAAILISNGASIEAREKGGGRH